MCETSKPHGRIWNVSTQPPSEAKHELTIQDVVSMNRMSAPAVSRDGSQIVFAVKVHLSLLCAATQSH
jgi:hypothetical protein